jgi:hypothetical protein
MESISIYMMCGVAGAISRARKPVDRLDGFLEAMSYLQAHRDDLSRDVPPARGRVMG